MANTGFILFRNVTIPKFSRIIKAVVIFTGFLPAYEIDTNLLCYFQDADNPNPPSDKTDLDGRSLTGAISWDNVEKWEDNLLYSTPNLASILQTVIDRDGWQSGNKVLFLAKDKSSESYRIWSAIEHRGGVEKAKLRVTWNPPEQIETPTILPDEVFQIEEFNCSIRTFPTDAAIHYTVDGSSPTILSPLYTAPFPITENTTVKAKAFKDYWTPSDIATKSYIIYGWILDSEYFAAMSAVPFVGTLVNSNPQLIMTYPIWNIENITIPQGSTIISSYMGIYSGGGSLENYLSIYLAFENSDNPSAPASSEEANNLLSNLTTKVLWEPSESWYGVSLHNSPDISAALQDIIDRPGWSSGNSVNFVILPRKQPTDILLLPNQDETRRVYGLAGDVATYRVTLNVTWDSGSGTYRPPITSTYYKEFRKIYVPSF